MADPTARPSAASASKFERRGPRRTDDSPPAFRTHPLQHSYAATLTYRPAYIRMTRNPNDIAALIVLVWLALTGETGTSGGPPGRLFKRACQQYRVGAWRAKPLWRARFERLKWQLDARGVSYEEVEPLIASRAKSLIPSRAGSRRSLTLRYTMVLVEGVRLEIAKVWISVYAELSDAVVGSLAQHGKANTVARSNDIYYGIVDPARKRMYCWRRLGQLNEDSKVPVFVASGRSKS
ncbi:hypothetical protein DL768_006332 [Monosporascus sp. mg162]|nr:hypothetical protein DL768_006332 [Monosporascus sp. mg162]